MALTIPRPAMAGERERKGAQLALVRALLAQHGLSESHALEQTGFYCTVEDGGEIAVTYHTAADLPAAASVARSRGERALLGCCASLVECGCAVTLVMSPRTCVLFVTAAAPAAAG